MMSCCWRIIYLRASIWSYRTRISNTEGRSLAISRVREVEEANQRPDCSVWCSGVSTRFYIWSSSASGCWVWALIAPVLRELYFNLLPRRLPNVANH